MFVRERELALALLTAAAVRERAHEMLEFASSDALANFRIEFKRLAPTAEYVAAVIRTNYPDLSVPLHARSRHYVFGGHDLWSETTARWRDTASRARAEFDLAIVSVLLDAGAGPNWRYRDAATGLEIGRSEGLALATLRMFQAGLFSADPSDPLRADAERLAEIGDEMLAKGFGATEHNPISGLEGRARLLAGLGRAILAKPQIFAKHDKARAGGLFDHFAELAKSETLPAPSILHEVLVHLAPIWPHRLSLAGLPLGDCWRHPAIRRDDASDGLVPLHKLSQWLSFSLIEPLRRAGIAVNELDGLTGLAEYRNGGLFLDMGLIVPSDPAQIARPNPVESELVVEWRALTVALIDRLAGPVREALGIGAREFSLGSLLEGGTWAAGRKIAAQIRPDGRPPLNVVSDGTTF